MKKIVLTGGGTAGHVTPNLALVDELQKQGFQVFYIGRKANNNYIIEKELVGKEIPYFGISSGKLRRYITKDNLLDGFRAVKGISDAVKVLKKIKPDIVFSKGGFVTAPVILGAKILNIPVVIHESDLTPGLANKISIPFAKCVCTSFEETLSYLPKNKGVVTGPPIRAELFQGNYEKGKKICGFTDNKPIIMIIGGSTGSAFVNKCVRDSLDYILVKYNVIHLCGKGNRAEISVKGYLQLEYAKEELAHMYAYSDIVISRAGSNSIFELLALQKPNILIPLSKKASRGDQILNANEFMKKGYSIVIEEEKLTSELLVKEINNLNENKKLYIQNMKKSNFTNGTSGVIEKIMEFQKK